MDEIIELGEVSVETRGPAGWDNEFGWPPCNFEQGNCDL
jgi:hypothetical protein